MPADDDDDYELELEAPTPRPDFADSNTSDPRSMTSDHYMRMAEKRIADDAKNEPPEPPEKPLTEGVFTFAFQFPALSYLLIVALALSVAALAFIALLYFLNVLFVLGRIIALPTGVLCAAAASYASACYLVILETTSTGQDKIEDWPEGDWREWFWSMPWTLGPAFAAAILGGLLSYIIPIHTWVLCSAMIFFLYPILQLSMLSNASIAAPFSAEIWRTFATHRLAWQFFYLLSFGMAVCTFLPLLITSWINLFLAALIFGPIVATAAFIYARLMGRMAIMLAQTDEEEEDD